MSTDLEVVAALQAIAVSNAARWDIRNWCATAAEHLQAAAALIEDMTAVLERDVEGCASCNGEGSRPVIDSRDPNCPDAPCEDCAELRALIARAEGL